MTKNVDIEAMYRHLEDTVRAYNPSANFQQIRQAYEFARDHHGTQMRKDGSYAKLYEKWFGFAPKESDM